VSSLPFSFGFLIDASLLTFFGNTVTTLFNTVPKGFTRNAMEGISLHDFALVLPQLMVGVYLTILHLREKKEERKTRIR
jgi:hypothetical protein